MIELILASTSPFRKKQLEDLNIPFTVQASNVDEDIFKEQSLPAKNLAPILARAKAECVVKNYKNCAVIAADQIVDFNHTHYGKAGSAEKAIKQLESLNGHCHQLITSACCFYQGEYSTFTVVSEMHMRKLTREQISNYVYTDKAWDCAGSYKIEKNGLVLFKEIQTNDHSAIIGLPMMAVIGWLLRINFPVPALHSKPLNLPES